MGIAKMNSGARSCLRNDGKRKGKDGENEELHGDE